MVTVDDDVRRVETLLVGGRIFGPCGHRLAPWGWARERVVRGVEEERVWVRPRRGRCPVCAVTHVLLPVTVLVRRKDSAAVVWAGLVAAAAGAGHRLVADLLGRPAGTVRGWLRRFAVRAEEIRRVFTVVGVDLDPDPVPPAVAGSPAADAVAAVLFAAGAAGRRWDWLGLTVSPSRLAVSVTSGGLLAPPAAPISINTSRLWQ